ncbi:TetR/AcrR family transcriptional regulator, partial [Methylobacterium organophilum]|nr:TetR/AcrR family transcriptional regulator [Methylobacterium organophilum]
MPTGRRLAPEARERQIVEGAVAYFAEVGLDGHTRELARRLGITQPLLFRYFPTKAALIERIYAEVYLKRWDPAWEATVRDPALPVLERFRRFEIDYQRRIDDYAWLRIFVSAGEVGEAQHGLAGRRAGRARRRGPVGPQRDRLCDGGE